jgi:tRNA A37 threonylcarbamoyladenosine synthetase subunit TsaC/SUA5/YrdC
MLMNYSLYAVLMPSHFGPNSVLAIKGFCAQQGVVPSFSLNTHPDKLVDFPVLNVVSLKKARELVKFNHPKRYALIDRETEDGRKSSSSSDKTEQSIDSTSEGTEGITSDVEKGAMKRHLSSNIVFKFSEGRVVFDRIAAAFWPGSLVIVVTAASEKHFLSGFLSKEILLNPKGTDGLEKTLPYVALGCPSHPLSKRFLNEVGVPVISFPITGPSQHFCTKSKQVQNLFSAKNTGANETRVIPCIDGEDKREAFTVPTCVQSEPGPVVLLNENARIVHILRPGVKISKSSLQTALAGHKQQASSALPSITEQVIRAVLRKWQIVEN